MTAPATELLSSTEAIRLTGATVRQVDYWNRHGLLEYERAGEGSGNHRGLSILNVLQVRALRIISDSLRDPHTPKSRPGDLVPFAEQIRNEPADRLTSIIAIWVSPRVAVVVDLAFGADETELAELCQRHRTGASR